MDQPSTVAEEVVAAPMEQPDVRDELATSDTLAEVAVQPVQVPVDTYMSWGTSDGGTMEFCAGRESLEGQSA